MAINWKEIERQENMAVRKAAAKRKQTPPAVVSEGMAAAENTGEQVRENPMLMAINLRNGNSRDERVRENWGKKHDSIENRLKRSVNTVNFYGEQLESLGSEYEKAPTQKTFDDYNNTYSRYMQEFKEYEELKKEYDTGAYYKSLEKRAQELQVELDDLGPSREGRKNSARARSFAPQSASTEENDRKRIQAELDKISGEYYAAENKYKIGMVSEDAKYSQVYQDASTINSDLQKISYIANSEGDTYLSQGVETTTGYYDATKEKEYIKRKYGFTDEDMDAFSRGVGQSARVADLQKQLKGELEELSESLSVGGYNFERMSGYEQSLVDMAEAAAEAERNAQYASEHPIMSSIGSVFVAPLQGLEFIANSLSRVGHNNSRDLENYVPMNTANMNITNYVTTVRGQVSKDIEESTDWELFGINVASFLYNTGMSVADSAYSIATLGPASIYFMGGSAAAQRQKEIIDSGGTNSQAFWGGLAAGACETFFEKFSVDRLLSAKSVNGVKNLLKETAKQAGTEASEEVFTEISNIVFDAAIISDNSAYNKAVRAYMAEGATEEKAKETALLDMVANVAWAGAGGLISGGAMGSTTSTFNYAMQNSADTQHGAEFKRQWGTEYGEALDELIATGKEFAPKSDARVTAETVESKIAKGKEISAGELGRLWRVNTLAQQEQAAVYFNGEAPKNPNIGNIPTRAQLDDYAIKKQQYAYAVKMGETLRDYGIKNVVIEDMTEGVNARWDNGTVYVSSRLDTAQAINAKVAHEISHAAKQGDAAFSRDITAAMKESGIDVEAIVEKKLSTYKDFFKRQGKSAGWIEKNIDMDYALDEAAADYIGELMKNDTALRSLQNRPGLVGKIINAIERLTKGKSMVEQSEYHRLANRLREIAGVSENIQEPTRSPAQRVRAGEGATGRGAEDFARMGEIGAVSPVSDVGQAVSGDGVRYSIKYDQNNNPYVVIDNDILMDIPKNEWVKTVKDNLRQKFPDGVVVGKDVIEINYQSRSEMTYSKYTQRLMQMNPELYADKLRSTDNPDEILKASRNWVNEALMHPRNDNIQEFARGEVQMRIGDNDYSAQVIVAMRSNGKLLLYDILNMRSTNIQDKIKKSGAAIAKNPSPGTDRSATSNFNNSILNTYENSNTKFSVEDELTGEGTTGRPKLMWAVNTTGTGQGNRGTVIVPKRTIPKSPFVQYGQDVEVSASKQGNRGTAIVPKRTIPKSPFVQYLEDIKDGVPNNIRPPEHRKKQR